MSTRITYIYQGRMSTREGLLIREIYRYHTSFSNVLIYVYLTERASQRCTSHGGVHLKGVCISWARLFCGHASQRPAPHRLTSYPLLGQHHVQPRRSMDGKAR